LRRRGIKRGIRRRERKRVKSITGGEVIVILLNFDLIEIFLGGFVRTCRENNFGGRYSSGGGGFFWHK